MVAGMSSRSADEDAPPPLAAGAPIDSDLVVVAHLSRGRRSDVYRVHDEAAGTTRIAKLVRPDRRDDDHTLKRLREEGERIERLSHPCIARLVRPLDDGLLIEDVGGETLHRRLRGKLCVSWREVARIGAELGSALVAVHDQGFVHYDLKPENIVVGPDRYLIIDFDLARPPGHFEPGIGTRRYMAPEQARGGLVGPPADAWGLGVVLFRAATGLLPFPDPGCGDGDDDEPHYPQLDGRAPPVSTLREGGGDVALIIDALLDPRPACRPMLEWAVETFAAMAPL